ncbi:unnamed protein product [Trifolium pratense]|uniref:Uncharacterized protein n=1 Tax=Trifolium pratense TaxID=57577 RepID=A0ACB0JNU2_TRIPR|nr:unnamed protein product [Trifolium pratense]
MASSQTLTVLILILISLFSPTLSVFDLNVSEVMTSQAAGTGADSLNVAAGIISSLQIDVELTVPLASTLFIPVDAAFNQLPHSARSKFQSLTVDERYIFMKAHIVNGYYPPTVLRSVNKMCPTLASEEMGTTMYLLNISASGGSSAVTISTAIVEAVVNRTVYSQHPIAIYVVSKVLLPIEIFGGSGVVAPPRRFLPRGSPPPSLRSGQPPLLSPQMYLVAALSFFLYCFVI